MNRSAQALTGALLLLGMLGASRHAVAADIVITNARVFDGTGRDSLANASVIIENGRVLRVEPGTTTQTAPVTIDAQGKTVMPGLINGHFHLFWDFYSTPPVNPATSDAQALAYMRDIMPGRLKAHLQQGITSLYSPIDYTPHIFDLRAKVAAGEMSGPRLFVAGPVLMHSGHHYACTDPTPAALEWCNQRISLPTDTPEQARASVRALADKGVDVIAFDAVTNQPELDTASLAAMVQEAHQRGLRVVSHNTNSRDVPALVEAGIDGFVHPPGISPDPEGSRVSVAGRQGLPLTITLGFYQRYIAEGHATPADIQNYEIQLSNVKHMLAAGAVPIFASDMPGLAPEEVVPTVTGVMSGVGLDNKRILLSATRDAARALLGRPDLGTLEPGQIADLIMLDGDPVADLAALTKVQLVIKDGKIVSDQRQE